MNNGKSEALPICRLCSTELFSAKFQENSRSTAKRTVFLGVYQGPGRKLQNFRSFPGVVDKVLCPQIDLSNSDESLKFHDFFDLNSENFPESKAFQIR